MPDGLSIISDGIISGVPTGVAFTGSLYATTLTAMDDSVEIISSNQFIFNVTDETNDIIFANGMKYQ